MQWENIIISVITVIVGQGLLLLASRRKTVAETTDIITKAAGNIVEALKGEISRLEVLVDRQRQEIHSLGLQVSTLRVEVRRLGGDPDMLLNPTMLNQDQPPPSHTQ